METNSFPELVNKYFRYLIDEFQYSISEKPYGPRPFNYGEIFFNSNTTIIKIVRDQSRPLDIISVVIKPKNAPDDAEMSLIRIVEAFGIDHHFLAAINPRDLEKSIEDYAWGLREYFMEFILGDFTRWNSVLTYFINYMKRDYLAMSGSELPEGAYRAIEEYINHH